MRFITFYFIALKAQVPIVMIGIDYTTKTISATKAIMPSGDIEKERTVAEQWHSSITS